MTQENLVLVPAVQQRPDVVGAVFHRVVRVANAVELHPHPQVRQLLVVVRCAHVFPVILVTLMPNDDLLRADAQGKQQLGHLQTAAVSCVDADGAARLHTCQARGGVGAPLQGGQVRAGRDLDNAGLDVREHAAGLTVWIFHSLGDFLHVEPRHLFDTVGLYQHGGRPQMHGRQGLTPEPGTADNVHRAFLGHVNDQMRVTAHADRRHFHQSAVFRPAVELVVKRLQAANGLVHDLMPEGALDGRNGMAVKFRPVDNRSVLVHECHTKIVRQNRSQNRLHLGPITAFRCLRLCDLGAIHHGGAQTGHNSHGRGGFHEISPGHF